MNYYGDFNADETVYIPFNTFDSDGASITVTDLASTDIKVHKDGAVAERASSSGYAVVIDFDGITGNHLITIDTSNNDDAGWYTGGTDYQVRVEGITVDTQTLNAWVGSFSLTNRSALRPTTAGRTLDVSATGEAGLDYDNVKAATAPTTLTNITIPVCTLNSDMVGTAGANTVVPDIAGTAAALHTTTDALINGLNDISVADIIAGIADGSYDLQEMIRIIFAFAAGLSNGGNTPTLNFRDSADTKNRIQAAIDQYGNRTARTLDGS